MKKILCTLLCLVLCVCALASCGDPVLGDVPPSYEPHRPKPIEKITLNMYIICGDETTENAKITVATRIAQETVDKFNTNLVVHYVTAANYASVLEEKTAAGAEDRADIVLIDSKATFNKLKDADLLTDLTSYYEGTAYGKLNVSINSELLKMSKVDGKLYTVPNNHLFGEYEYIKIDVDVATRYYKSPQTIAENYTTPESIEELKELIANDSYYDGRNADDLVCVVSGKYEDKAMYEAQGFYCNISKYPVATEEDAFSSAFAIIKGANADRAMEIIYDINGASYKSAEKAELRNLLQYGILGTNYLVNTADDVDDIDPFTTGNNVYSMNLAHTGDVFKASFSSKIGWTEEVYNNVKKQLDDASKHAE